MKSRSGKRGLLPAPTPLRTVHMIFTIHGSSTVKHCLTRAGSCIAASTFTIPTKDNVHILRYAGPRQWTSHFLSTNPCLHYLWLPRDSAPGGRLLAFARDNVVHRTQSLSNPLQIGIRFFRHPIPAYSSAHLAACFPCGRYTGVSKFHLKEYVGLDTCS